VFPLEQEEEEGTSAWKVSCECSFMITVCLLSHWSLSVDYNRCWEDDGMRDTIRLRGQEPVS
jgi:hypothetical protein